MEVAESGNSIDKIFIGVITIALSPSKPSIKQHCTSAFGVECSLSTEPAARDITGESLQIIILKLFLLKCCKHITAILHITQIVIF